MKLIGSIILSYVFLIMLTGSVAISATTETILEYRCRIWINNVLTERIALAEIGRAEGQALARIDGLEAQRVAHFDPDKKKWGLFQFLTSGFQFGALSALGIDVQPDLMDGSEFGWIYPLYLSSDTEKIALSCFRND